VDNSEMGLKSTSSYKPTSDPLKTLVLRVYFAYLPAYWTVEKKM